MAWNKSSERWLSGRIQDKEDQDDVIGWIKNDPVWKRADEIDLDHPNGSHIGTVHIRGMSQLLKRWDRDMLQISSTGGRWIKKWIIDQLVKAYRELESLEESK